MQKNANVANYLKAIHFDHPEWIPAQVALLPSAWLEHGEALEEVALAFPQYFPGYRAGGYRDVRLPRRQREGRWTDAWGIVWDNAREGMASIPVESEAPLRNWAAFADFRPPDIETVDDDGNARDWAAFEKRVEQTKARGGLASGGLVHGFMFMRLFYLRGFANFMLDVATRDPRLDELIEMVRAHNVALVSRCLAAGVEMMRGGDDMGMQTSLAISPGDWLRYLKPCLEAIWGPCRDRGVPVYQHSDGHILDIIPHLVECGVSVVDPQIRANTLHGIVDVAKGKVCIQLDLDRQLFPFATPEQAREHIVGAKEALYMPEGGLMMRAACAHDVRVEVVRAICEAFDEIGCGPSV